MCVGSGTCHVRSQSLRPAMVAAGCGPHGGHRDAGWPKGGPSVRGVDEAEGQQGSGEAGRQRLSGGGRRRAGGPAHEGLLPTGGRVWGLGVAGPGPTGTWRRYTRGEAQSRLYRGWGGGLHRKERGQWREDRQGQDLGGTGAWTPQRGSPSRSGLKGLDSGHRPCHEILHETKGWPQGDPGHRTAGERGHLLGPTARRVGRKGWSSDTRLLLPHPPGNASFTLTPATPTPKLTGGHPLRCPSPGQPAAGPGSSPAPRPGVQEAQGLSAQASLAVGPRGPAHSPPCPARWTPAPNCAGGRDPNYPASCQEIKDMPTFFKTSL